MRLAASNFCGLGWKSTSIHLTQVESLLTARLSQNAGLEVFFRKSTTSTNSCLAPSQPATSANLVPVSPSLAIPQLHQSVAWIWVCLKTRGAPQNGFLVKKMVAPKRHTHIRVFSDVQALHFALPMTSWNHLSSCPCIAYVRLCETKLVNHCIVLPACVISCTTGNKRFPAKLWSDCFSLQASLQAPPGPPGPPGPAGPPKGPPKTTVRPLA